LRDRIAARRALAEIEAAQLVVERAGELDLDGGGTRWKRLGDDERRHLSARICVDACLLCTTTRSDRDGAELEFSGVQRDA
jgi:hypothetical protein